MNAVLKQYPPSISNLTWHPLGPAGGFSGASVWRGELHGKPLFALKAWPTGFSAEKLRHIHRWMIDARLGGKLDFVPQVWPCNSGQTVAEAAGRVWDVCSWLSGTANFECHPSEERVRAACRAIAELHRVWATRETRIAPCPGVERRLLLLRTFDPDFSPFTIADHELSACLEVTLPTLRRAIPLAIAELEPWWNRPGPVQPCPCDIWHDHVLFEGERVTGIIDYGSMKFDHPAVDLARWLGDVVGDDADKFRLGLAAYRDAGGPWDPDYEFVSLLDRTGVICAVIHWWQRLSAPRRPHDRERVIDRVRKLTARLTAISLQLPASAARILSPAVTATRATRD